MKKVITLVAVLLIMIPSFVIGMIQGIFFLEIFKIIIVLFLLVFISYFIINKQDLVKLNLEKKDLPSDKIKYDEYYNKIPSLLSNNNESSLLVSSKALIVANQISQSKITFYKDDIIGKNIFEVLSIEKFRNSSKFISLLDNFIKNESSSDLFSFKLKPLQKGTRTLDITATKVLKNNDFELLFLIKDISQIKTLRSELNKAKENKYLRNSILSEMAPSYNTDLEHRRYNIYIFLQRSMSLISEVTTFLSKRDINISRLDLTTINKNLDTLSKIAIDANLNTLANLIEKRHKFKDILKSDKGISDNLSEKWINFIFQLKALFDLYIETGKDIFGIDFKNPKGEVPKAHSKLKHIKNVINNVISDVKTREEINKQLENVFRTSLNQQLSNLYKMVEDLSQELNKSIIFEVSGDEIFTDERESMMIVDSVIHIIRNSIDHGIEEPQERLHAKKKRDGKIKITLTDLNKNFIIKIDDDGRGIDKKKLSLKAIESNKIERTEYSKYTEEEKLSLIFKMGLSSKDGATEISGRGVGMNVVKENIEGLGGSIEIQTIPEKGTSFIIKI
ncbi:ATP-binding protein [Bacteriovoracales bacterium]|nr:ATP-binding protein [Bacteriovoracales bacterium]